MSIDQLESSTPGLIAQLRGKPTTKRYTCVTVFVDQYSRYGYVVLQKTKSIEETIQAKKSFERLMATHGVKVEHYHADNGVFADASFQREISQANQTISFCAVNAHFQNGIAEKRIRDIQDLGRTMLLHANRRWQNAITPHLWPYAIRHANEVINNTPSAASKELKTPLQTLTRSDVNINPKH